MSKIRIAHSIWSEKGTFPLIRETAGWLYRRPYEKFSDYRGYQYFTIGDVTAEFGTANREAITMLRLIYQWEKDVVAQILETLRTDDVFFDIGANLGLYTAFASHKVPEGSVVAFEPHPPNVSELLANAERNGENIDIHDIALSDSWGTASFQQSNEQAGSQVGALSPQRGDAAYEVETAPVDGLISEDTIPAPNVVKIDVEGAEPLVLEGMEETLTRDSCRVVFCEIHPPTNDARPSIRDFGATVDELRSSLRSKGFEVQVSNPDRGEKYLIARQDERRT